MCAREREGGGRNKDTYPHTPTHIHMHAHLHDLASLQVSEWENHLSSYDHHHRKRLKELKQMDFQRKNGACCHFLPAPNGRWVQKQPAAAFLRCCLSLHVVVGSRWFPLFCQLFLILGFFFFVLHCFATPLPCVGSTTSQEGEEERGKGDGKIACHG